MANGAAEMAVTRATTTRTPAAVTVQTTTWRLFAPITAALLRTSGGVTYGSAACIHGITARARQCAAISAAGAAPRSPTIADARRSTERVIARAPYEPTLLSFRMRKI